jgi:hypothetical protein
MSDGWRLKGPTSRGAERLALQAGRTGLDLNATSDTKGTIHDA